MLIPFRVPQAFESSHSHTRKFRSKSEVAFEIGNQAVFNRKLQQEERDERGAKGAVRILKLNFDNTLLINLFKFK